MWFCNSSSSSHYIELWRYRFFKKWIQYRYLAFKLFCTLCISPICAFWTILRSGLSLRWGYSYKGKRLCWENVFPPKMRGSPREGVSWWDPGKHRFDWYIYDVSGWNARCRLSAFPWTHAMEKSWWSITCMRCMGRRYRWMDLHQNWYAMLLSDIISYVNFGSDRLKVFCFARVETGIFPRLANATITQCLALTQLARNQSQIDCTDWPSRIKKETRLHLI